VRPSIGKALADDALGRSSGALVRSTKVVGREVLRTLDKLYTDGCITMAA